jgi:O-antigen/teichoic acid export membrane protein
LSRDPVAAASAWHHDRRHLALLARGGILNVAGALTSGIASFLFVAVVARALGAARAGPFFVAIALFSLLSRVLELGADTGVVRMIPRELAAGRPANTRGIVRVALFPVVVAAVLAAIGGFATAPDIADLLVRRGDPEAVASLLRALAPFLPVAAAYTVVVAATRGFGSMVPSVTVDRLGKPVLQLLLAGSAVALGMGTTALVLAWTLPTALGLIGASMWLAALVARTGGGGATHDVGLGRAFWGFTAPRALAGLFQVAITWLDTLLISALSSTREAGIYAAATRYVLVGSFAITAILHAVGPKMSELITRGDHRAARAVFQVSTGWLILLTWPIYLTLLWFAPVLLSLFGEGYPEAATAVRILSAAMLVATGVGTVDVVLLMGGKSTWNLANTLIALVLNVGLNLLLIPRLGMVGAALAWAASILANNLLPLAQTRFLLHLHPFGRDWLLAAGVVALTFGAGGAMILALVGATHLGFAVHAAAATCVSMALIVRSRDRRLVESVLAALQTQRGSRSPL